MFMSFLKESKTTSFMAKSRVSEHLIQEEEDLVVFQDDDNENFAFDYDGNEDFGDDQNDDDDDEDDDDDDDDEDDDEKEEFDDKNGNEDKS